ncbi:hypothetical protein ACMHYO_16700 [Allopusillimonas ginsengisoli]|uniref:hypothetical protein n=1 Tax=Allopusillimonas ginsengisoli TaxID=453575 RepID=UPI00148502A8
MKSIASHHVPVKWPFPARKGQGKPATLTRSAMMIDVVLVLAWGATIPGLMWLGVASGF